VVIIGAGPTGLGAALTFDAFGHEDVVVLEQAGAPGGLAGSVVDDAGFTWDLGGHVQFSHYEAYDRVLDRALGDAWLHHERTATIRLLGADIPYPFQHHLDALPARERAWAESTLATATRHPVDDSFAAWLLATFGEGICSLFLTPYNRKVWQHPLDAMSASWMGERVAVPREGSSSSSAAPEASRSRGWGPNARFRYPAHGGTGAIWRGVAALVPSDNMRFGLAVERVNRDARTVTLSNGERLPYDTLVSTLPLDVLVSIVEPALPGARDAARGLVANTVELVGVGVDLPPSPEMRRRTWMYFPEDASPYYRVTVLSNYAPSNAPDDRCYSLLTESSHPRGVQIDTDALARDTCRALVADGLIPAGAPLRSVWRHTLPRGYPVPTLGRDAALAALHEALEPCGIYARGRFGGWKYEVSNQDHSFMQGVELAERLLSGKPEVTYPHPAIANSRYARV
jgi:protoporphyrinogen oxidase